MTESTLAMAEGVVELPHPEILPKVKRWATTLDPIVEDVDQAVARQEKKPSRIINIKFPSEQPGVHFSPRWESYELLKIGQRRGIKDLVPRGGSAHNVTFCVAQFRTFGHDLPTTIQVAVKTFEKPRKAIEEVTKNIKVLERGFSTTNPICVVIDSNKAYIITPVREGVQPLDTEPWHQFNTGSLEARNHFISRMHNISLLLAQQIARGINHSDAQIKNFWVTSSGQIEAFDWESANIYEDPPTQKHLLTASLDDLRTLYRSLTNQIEGSPIHALSGPSYSKWQQFEQFILDDFIDGLINNFLERQILTDGLLDCIGEIRENLKREVDY